jgi:uncharacterized repeat protein (TIGR01451 family)
MSKKQLQLTFALALAAIVLISLLSGLPGYITARASLLYGGKVDPQPVEEPLPPGVTLQPDLQVQGLDLAWISPFPTDLTNSLAWGDYERDGDLDLLIGNNGSSRLFTNMGGGVLTTTLTLNCDDSIPFENTYAIAWGDPNRDGYLDIAVGNTGAKNCVYLYNPGLGSFQRIWQSDSVENTRSVAWSGWQIGAAFSTFLATGSAGDPTTVYRYESGVLSPWWEGNLGNTANSIAWGDYDNDGLPDLAIGNYGAATVIYHNDRTTLTPAFTTTEVAYTWSVAWGDMDGDGYLDLAVGNGRTASFADPVRVYRNGGPLNNFAFTLAWFSSDETPTHSVAWGDYDGDGDLDLAAASEADNETRIYLNSGTTLGSVAWWGGDLDLVGHAVAWADWDGDGDLELTVGYYGSAAVLYNNPQGTWKRKDLNAGGVDTRSVAWGDWDSDGDMDLAVGNSSQTPVQVYENTNGVLTLAWTAPYAENTRSVAWGDFNSDGRLDLAVGNGEEGGGLANRVYRNTGGNLVPWAGFSDLHAADTYAVAWGDYDGDGDLDLAAGNYGMGATNYIYINRGGVFTETIPLPVATGQTLSLAWGDFDQDHDLDLAIGNQGGPSQVLVNMGGGVFTSINLPSPTAPCATDARSVAWGDWDADGDLDLAVGNRSGQGCIQVIKATKSGNNWIFTPAWQTTDIGLDVWSVAWGDFDGDGRLDLAAGVSGSWGKRNRIYRNMGGSLVQNWVAPASDADATRSLAWGDIDNDGDLDLATGNTGAGSSRIYINTRLGSTNLANDPTGVEVIRPGSADEAWFFSSAEILGNPVISVPFVLYDDEYDRAVKIVPQISWDGGGTWEAAWAAVGGSGTTQLATSPDGIEHVFYWDAFNQLLVHQNIPFNPPSVYVPFPLSVEDMSVSFRILVWESPEHGGLVQHPASGSYTPMTRIDVRPDWSRSEMDALPELVHPGETVNFTTVITQTDHGLPKDAYFLDVLPYGLSVVDGSAYANRGIITATSEAITWTGVIPYQEQMWTGFTALVTRPLTNGLEIPNCAKIYDGMHEPFPICDTIIISSTPYLTESWKLVNDLPANMAFPGDVLTYTILLTNTGTDNAHSVVMTDALPANLGWLASMHASSGKLSYANRLLNWQGDVNVSKPVTITFNAAVVEPLPGNTVIVNRAWIDDNVNPPFFTTPVTTTVLAPDLSTSEKRASPSVVEIGDMLTYTIVLTNSGALDASLAEFMDPIPEGSLYIPGTFTASNGEGGYDPVTQAITWTGSVSVSHQVTLTFAIIAGMPQQPEEAVLTNTAVIYDPVGGPITLVATTTVLLPDMSPSIKWGYPAVVQLGDPITYSIVLNNAGGNSPGLDFSDRLPFDAVYVSGSFTATSGYGGYSAGNRSVFWEGDLRASESVTMSFSILASCPAVITDTVILNQAQVEDIVGFTTIMSTTNNINLPNLSTSTFVDDVTEVKPGALILYTMVLNNQGGLAPAAWMLDQLPPQVEWTGVSYASYGTISYSPVTRRVRWDGDLQSGASVVITFQVRVLDVVTVPQIENIASLYYDCGLAATLTVETAVNLGQRVYLPLMVK